MRNPFSHPKESPALAAADPIPPSPPSAPTPQGDTADEALDALSQYLKDELHDLTRKPELPRSAPHAAEVEERLIAAQQGLHQTFVNLEHTVGLSSVGSARNSLRLKALAKRIEESHEGMAQISEAAAQIQQGIELVAGTAGEAAQVAKRVEDLTDAGHDYGQQAETATCDLQQQIQEMTERLGALMDRVKEITRVSRVIDGIAVQTRMLALNAAIEAARAGQYGRGFAVVASEVGALAEKAGNQTKEIGALVRDITSQLEPVRLAVAQCQELVRTASSRTSEVGRALAEIRSLARTSAAHMEQVAAAVEEQTALMEQLYASTRQATNGINGVQQEAGFLARATAELARQSEEAYANLGRYRVDTIFHRALDLIRQLAVDVRRVFEEQIDAGRLTLDEVLQLRYTEIKGPAIKKLAKFFDVSKVPESGFNPPKYSTAYDDLVDVQIQKLLDAVEQAEPRIQTTTAMDLNGYIPIHPSKSCADWTGDYEKDLVGNRAKKIYLGASLRGARMGLANAEKLPERATREDFIRAGCDLRESAKAAQEFLVQTYARDTGEVVFLVTVPLFIKGHRWGVTTATWAAK